MVSSVARCWASLALPPLPKKRILPPPRMQETHASSMRRKAGPSAARVAAATAICSSNSLSNRLIAAVLYHIDRPNSLLPSCPRKPDCPLPCFETGEGGDPSRSDGEGEGLARPSLHHPHPVVAAARRRLPLPLQSAGEGRASQHEFASCHIVKVQGGKAQHSTSQRAFEEIRQPPVEHAPVGLLAD